MKCLFFSRAPKLLGFRGNNKLIAQEMPKHRYGILFCHFYSLPSMYSQATIVYVCVLFAPENFSSLWHISNEYTSKNGDVIAFDSLICWLKCIRFVRPIVYLDKITSHSLWFQAVQITWPFVNSLLALHKIHWMNAKTFWRLCLCIVFSWYL